VLSKNRPQIPGRRKINGARHGAGGEFMRIAADTEDNDPYGEHDFLTFALV
jgi:hypothetical protein